MKRLFRTAIRVLAGQSGITGLETAIVLIAFVMVASVFAYVVLSAGLFSSQKAKEAIQKGLEGTQGSIEVRGNVLGKMEFDEATGKYFCTEIYIFVATVSDGSSIDFTDTSEGNNTVVISYVDNYQQIAALDFSITKVATVNDDDMLDPTELFQITVDLSAVNEGAADPAQRLGSYSTFTLEIRPPSGSILQVQRTLPARTSPIVNLY